MFLIIPVLKQVIGLIIAFLGMGGFIWDLIASLFKSSETPEIRATRYIQNSIWFVGGLIIIFC